MSVLLLAEQAREILGMPENWHVAKFESIRQGGPNAGRDAPVLHFAITGLCCPVITRGKNKGFPDYKRGDRTTERTAYITPAQSIEWRQQWKARTGKCVHCLGKGHVVDMWSHISGPFNETCPNCLGTGESQDPNPIPATANSPQG